MIRILSRTSGFTLIEIIVGMLIFSIGMTGILAILHTTINNSLYSRHEIVVANLLREEVELIKNMRNSNKRNFIPFDSVQFIGTTGTGFSSGTYIVENNYTHSWVEIDMNTGNIRALPMILSGVILWPTLESKYLATRLFLDDQGRYTHTHTATGTFFASYIRISPLEVSTLGILKKDGKEQGYILDARVIVQWRGYNEYDLKTVITDWKK